MEDKKVEIVSLDENLKALQQALYWFREDHPFIGTLLQEITFKFRADFPHRAAMGYNKKTTQFELILNSQLFPSTSLIERKALLHHEILHFSHSHLFRIPQEGLDDKQKKLYNIAADMAINQYITGLPEGCIDVAKWKYQDEKGKTQPFPLLKSMEEYYNLIVDDEKGADENKEEREKYMPYDGHEWPELTEAEKEEMMGQVKKMVERTMEKTRYDFDALPQGIKDLYKEIEVQLGKMNYKKILAQTIKRTVSSVDRGETWKKPNKRYGAFCKGTTLGRLPQLAVYADCSGSISIKEQNLFLGIMENFLKAGTRKCILGLWHTSLFYRKPHKLNQRIKEDEWESGGTDVTCVIQDIVKNKPDLAIILTDGYYDSVGIKPSTEIIFIISEGGNMQHPLAHMGKTIPIKSLE